MARYAIAGFLVLLLLLLQREVAVARLQYQPELVDGGVTFVLVKGKFDYDDDLQEFLLLVERYDPVAVVFDSEGGNIAKAMELGRIIRRLGISTIQPRQLDCASACALAFMGGVERIADPGAIGVHKSSFSDGVYIDPETAVSMVQEMTAEIITYMIEMGVEPSLLQLSLKYDADDVRYLSKGEMKEFRLITDHPSNGSKPGTSDTSRYSTYARPNQTQPAEPKARLPVARSGVIRHPRGIAELKSAPTAKSANLDRLANGTSVQILRNSKRWYFISSGSGRGFMHHSWIRVDQYDHSPGLLRHIQIKSFDKYEDAVSYVKSSEIPLSVYLATNGWFAVTLAQPLDRATAIDLKTRLKNVGAIPDDSFVTFGNTYMLRACCK